MLKIRCGAAFDYPAGFTMKHIFALLLFLGIGSTVLGQDNFKISGYVKDAETGEDLPAATIQVAETGAAQATNNYGFYAFTLPPGNYTLKVSYIGYTPLVQPIVLDKNISLNLNISPQKGELQEVVITGDKPSDKVKEAQMSQLDLQIDKVKELPVLFGEVDILKTLQLLPGVQSGSEGTTGFYVRGGGPDQNLIILDEAIVYNASHLFGFFSVFNSDAIKGVELYKGGFPAQFGGRLSSVVDITLKEGNKKEFAGAGGIGLIASRLTLEGPIVKDKSSFIISGRRTYLDVFTRAINRANKGKENFNPIPDYYFYDLNAKVNYDLGPKDRLFLSGYFGRDVFGFNQDAFNFDFNWGNSTLTARWNHILGARLFSNTTATFTRYQYRIKNKIDLFSASIGSDVQDLSLKSDFNYSPDQKHFVRFGGSAVYHTFGVSRISFKVGNDGGGDVAQDKEKFGTELGIYASDDWEVTPLLKVNAGLRISAFSIKDRLYGGPEPRVNARYLLNEKWSLKASYAFMNQYVHLVSNSGSSFPTDIWYPSTKTVRPQKSHQAALGYSTSLLKNKLYFTQEGYYKRLNQQIDFRDGAQLFFNPELDSEFVFGKGWSYGTEFFLEKREGKLTGWVGYTLSWSFRKFPDINSGQTFFPKYDRRHDISVVGIYEVSKRITLSATWVYGTGNTVSLPVAYAYTNDIQNSQPFISAIFTERNGYRMAPYHRMDLGIVWKFTPKWGTSDLTFSVYNLYNRRNPFILYIETEEVDDNVSLGLPIKSVAKQISLFPVIPTLTYNFRF